MKCVIKSEQDGWYVISIDWAKGKYNRTKIKKEAHQYKDKNDAQKDCDEINKFTLFDKFIIEPA